MPPTDDRHDTIEEVPDSTNISYHSSCPLPNIWHNMTHFPCFRLAKSGPNKPVQKEQGNDAQDDNIMHKDAPGDLNKKRKGGWKTMPYIIGNETCERLAMTGLFGNMIVYLTTKYNMKNVAAANVLNIWSGTTSLATLPGAFVADSYFGRFRMIIFGCLADLMGLAILTVTALISRLRPSTCTAQEKNSGKCEAASSEQFGFLILSFCLLSLGAAGIRPSSISFAAEQFDQKDAKAKARLQINWGLGFGICTLLMLISTIFFVLGGPRYIHEIPKGSPFTGFAQVIVAAIRNRHLSLPSDTSQLYHSTLPKRTAESINYTPRHRVTDQFRFLNKATIITDGDFAAQDPVVNHWRTSSIEQQDTFTVLQAGTMNRRLAGSHVQVPASSFSVFSLLVVILWLPFYDRVVLPLARRITKQSRGISFLQRLGIGYAFSATSMLVAGFVEVKRRNTAITHGLLDQPSAVVPISAFWLLPQYCIGGLATAFHAVGSLEFYYSQFPSNMRSTAIAVSSCTLAMGAYLSTVIVSLVHKTTGHNGQPDWLDDNLNRGHLEYFFWLLCGMETVNLVYFVICSRWYKYRESVVVEETEDSDLLCHHELHTMKINTGDEA
eukprot:Gb_20643 [translate_table: standard]